jgi:hypothetical protein
MELYDMNMRIKKKKIKYKFFNMTKNDFVVCYIPMDNTNSFKMAKNIKDILNKLNVKGIILPTNIVTLNKINKKELIISLKEFINKLESEEDS